MGLQRQCRDVKTVDRVLLKCLGAKRTYLAYSPTILAVADFISACETTLDAVVKAAVTSLTRALNLPRADAAFDASSDDDDEEEEEDDDGATTATTESEHGAGSDAGSALSGVTEEGDDAGQ